MYVLIITLVLNFGFTGGITAQEFTSKENCETAGETWVKQMNTPNDKVQQVKRSALYICVQK